MVICKDTPNFIANRFISVAGGFGMNYAYDHGYTVEEIDLLTGPLIGRPKSGTFRLADVVGIDVLAYVAPESPILLSQIRSRSAQGLAPPQAHHAGDRIPDAQQLLGR